MKLPIQQRVLEDIQHGRILTGKELDLVLRWIVPRAKRAMEKASKRKAIKANPVLAAQAKNRSDHSAFLRAADDAFSILVRTLGTKKASDGKRYGPCVTCDRILPFKELQAGHCIVRGKWGTRFDLRNVHCQSFGCNAKHLGNGKVPQHEGFIERVHGIGTLKALKKAAKFNPHRPFDQSLAAMAENFMAQAIFAGYRPEDVA